MGVFLSHRSSYKYWQQASTAEGFKALRLPRQMSYTSVKAINKLDSLSFLKNDTADLTVSQARARGGSSKAHFHVNKRAPHTHKYYMIGEDVAVSSPESCFLELAGEMTKLQLIVAGFSLCSKYYIRDDKFHTRNPVTSVRKISKFLAKHPRTESCKKALSALLYVCDNSASPMESFLSIALITPRRLGGYNIKKPRLNAQVQSSNQGVMLRKGFECDLLWTKNNVAVEYDSNLHHLNEAKFAQDSARRAGLQNCGIQVITVTTRQFFNNGFFDEVARALAYFLHKYIPKSKPDFLGRRSELVRYVSLYLDINKSKSPHLTAV